MKANTGKTGKQRETLPKERRWTKRIKINARCIKKTRPHVACYMLMLENKWIPREGKHCCCD